MRVLYIVYWGALEQLGQSLVVPAIKEIARLGADITLVTFEKKSDLADIEAYTQMETLLETDRVEWIPLTYHKTPKTPATFFDIAAAVAMGLKKRLRKKYDVVHGRTYLGGLMGMALASLIGAKFVYHNEGFYPDEQVDGGIWQQDSGTHQVSKRLEKIMYSRADGIIALSRRAKAEIEGYSFVRNRNTPVVFVPSCVDLDRFRLNQHKPCFDDGLRLVYIGSVGGRYILDKVGDFVRAVVERGEKVTLDVYNKVDQKRAEEMLRGSGLAEDSWRIDAVPYSDMPKTLTSYHAGLFFLAQGLSEHGCSPTKVGEYWAVGLPVVTTPNVSDTDDIISEMRVGVIVSEHTEKAYLRAFEELVDLLMDAELPLRCRKAAEKYYGLKPACKRQIELYSALSVKQ